MMAPRKVDPTGRSSDKRLPLGASKRHKLEGAFIPHLRAMRESPGFRALPLAARRVLDFLELEHLKHGGAENGHLHAPYAQLRLFGISGRDIKPAFSMLEAFGLIERTDERQRLGGRPNAARYRLTWLATSDGGAPTHDYLLITEADVRAILEERAEKAARKRGRHPCAA